MTKRLFLATALALASFGASAEAVTYDIDPSHTVVLATWNHVGYSNPSANFGGASGTITYDAQAPENSSVKVTLPLSGLDSFVAKLDEHLRGSDFFDAAKFPEATFASTSVRAVGENRFEVAGTLTIKGISKPVVLDVVLNKAGPHPMGNVPTIGFDATATVKRSDFDLAMGVPMVSDEVSLRITTEAQAAP
jgi:polyisoprenoid-binding protein YceI